MTWHAHGSHFRSKDWTCGRDDAIHDGYGDDRKNGSEREKKEARLAWPIHFGYIVEGFISVIVLEIIKFRYHVFAIMYYNFKLLKHGDINALK